MVRVRVRVRVKLCECVITVEEALEFEELF